MAEYFPSATTESSTLDAQLLADPSAAVTPIAYSLAEYSDVSTFPPKVVAHSFAAPRLAVVVTSVPPIAHALAL